jgi:two-component system chemotaxis response regulator CheY
VKILIADDDLLFRRMLEAELSRAGHEVVSVGDGREAWALLQAERIRLVVADWLMPGLDGATLIRRVREAGWPGYTYAILLTARDGHGDVVEGFAMGADDYVTKPFRVEELLARIGAGVRILEVERQLTESLAREEARATRDALTGLPNRRALCDQARAEISRAVRERTSVGVIMVDLDDFKSINDRFGHAAGDEALRRVAGVLQESRRAYDFTGRWGGDEFLVILPGATASQAGRVAERIRAAIHAIELPVAGTSTASVRASLGVAAAIPAQSPVGLDELLARADDAMYRTKRDGGDRVILHAPRTEDEHRIPVRQERS